MYGKNFIYQREQRNISQEQLAKATGISQAAISLWESDKRVPNVTACVIIADFYGITVDELIGHEVKKNWE